MKTLIKNVHALLPDGTTPLTNIMIEGDRIKAMGEVPDGFLPDKTIDGKDHLFVNRAGQRALSQDYFHVLPEKISRVDYENIMYKNAENFNSRH